MEAPTLEQTPRMVYELDRKLSALSDVILSKLSTQGQNEEQPLDVRGISEFLGISTDTTYRYTQDRNSGFPFHKRRGRLYFYKSEVSAWIKSGKAGPEDIEGEVDQLLSA